MKTPSARLVLAGLFLVLVPSSGPACGPWYPASFLDTPGAPLRAPITGFGDEVLRLPSPPAPPKVAPPAAQPLSDDRRDVQYPAQTLEAETADLASTLAAHGDPQAQPHAAAYRQFREEAGRRLAALRQAAGNHAPDPAAVRTAIDSLAWPKGLPKDIALYTRGALTYEAGDLPAAIDLWKKLLALPAAQRRDRSVWAAWMIARATRESDGLPAALPSYQLCEKLAADGFPDPFHLGCDSLGWQARAARDQGDYARACTLYYHQAMTGDPGAWISLRWSLSRWPKWSPEELQTFARDPFLRGLLTAEVLTELSNFSDPAANDDAAKWLAAIDAAGAIPVTEAPRLAELSYALAQFDDAKRWLAHAPADDPRAAWIRGKLALMEGRTADAEKDLRLAAQAHPLQIGEGAPIWEEDLWNFTAGGTRPALRTAQLYGDLATTALGNDHFTDALLAFQQGSYAPDAAYIAERLLTPAELLAYTRAHFPAPTGSVGSRESMSLGDRFRYLTARRLARTHHFKTAREFYPPELLPIYDRYLAILDLAQSGVLYPKPQRAAAWWELAQLHRSLGMELFGAEGEPDNTADDGDYEAPPYLEQRLGLHLQKNPLYTWTGVDQGDMTPPATPAERARAGQSRLLSEERFHYRYVAADIAWIAARLMPNNSPDTARVLGTAGAWLKYRDPQAADRFYKAMIWRNWSTPLAREADKLRWFPPIPWDYDPFASNHLPHPNGVE